MKRMFWIAALLIVAVAVVLTGCARQTPSEVVDADGGVHLRIACRLCDALL